MARSIKNSGYGKAVIRVKGAEEIIKALKEVEPRLAKKILRQALRKGLKPIVPIAKADAPVETGALQKAIILRAATRRKNRISMRIRLGKGTFFKGDQFYGGFQEFGWKPGRRGGPRGAEIPGKHFMEKAFKTGAPAAIQTTLAELTNGFEQVVNELGKG